MTNHDKIISKAIYDKEGPTSNWMRLLKSTKRYKNITQYLLNRYPDSTAKTETMYRIVFNIEERPTCPVCGKPVRFRGVMDDKFGFRKYCSGKCGSNAPDVRRQRQETCMKKYGVDHVWKCQEVKDKIKLSHLEKYGTEYWNQSEYGREKMSKISKSKEVLDKRHKTCMERYGVEDWAQSKEGRKYLHNKLASSEVKEKQKATFLERYGVAYIFQNEESREKAKKTCVERYGAEHWSSSYIGKTTLHELQSSEEVRDKIKSTCLERFNVDNVFKAKEVQDKWKKTCIERYGVDNWAKSEIGKEKLSNILSKSEVREKVNNTKKQNNTFNSSEQEKEILKLLLEKFPNTKYQYSTDPRYPFVCDYYIPSIDLFIEFQGSWTHDDHPYDIRNEKDIEKVKKWKLKSEQGHEYYANALETWTIRDPHKRDIAKQNNLNYIEWWTLEEAKEWIDTYDCPIA